MMYSTLVISQNLDYAKKEVENRINSDLIKRFYADEVEKSGEFKIEFAKDVLKEAYIAEKEKKYIILSALSYNITVQNFLLKILEEPPKNIVFILIGKSKRSFLPTILSRLKIEILKSKKELYELDLNVKNLTLEDIFNFLQKNKNISKDELRQIIQTLLIKTIQADIKLNSFELDLFDRSLELASLNGRPQNILSSLLLSIYQSKVRGKS